MLDFTLHFSLKTGVLNCFPLEGDYPAFFKINFHLFGVTLTLLILPMLFFGYEMLPNFSTQ